MSSKTFPWKSSSSLIKPFFEIDEPFSREFTRSVRFQGPSGHGEEIERLVAGGLGRGGQGVKAHLKQGDRASVSIWDIGYEIHRILYMLEGR
jgi:hypothetical protein